MYKDFIIALLPISMALSRSLRPSETGSTTGAGGDGAGAMGTPGGIGGGETPGCIAIGGRRGGGGGAGTFGRTGGGGGAAE